MVHIIFMGLYVIMPGELTMGQSTGMILLSGFRHISLRRIKSGTKENVKGNANERGGTEERNKSEVSRRQEEGKGEGEEREEEGGREREEGGGRRTRKKERRRGRDLI